MSKLQFFKGHSSKLSSMNKQPCCFYFVEDTHDMYYTTDYNELITIFANPQKRIKQVLTYYSVSTSNKPTQYPPNENEWKLFSSDYVPGQPGYSIECTVFMDGTYKYSKVRDYITEADIDLICSQNDLSTSVVGEM